MPAAESFQEVAEISFTKASNTEWRLCCDCFVNNCQSVHIACECLPQLRVPDEEREDMRDQRSKTGTKGALQISPVDRRTLATEKAKIARRAKQPPMRGQRHHQIVADPVNEVSYS